ncbi:MAG TPA: hypothetical protein VNQ76_02700, partial [Planctomicrobium sp.]|nr:hypothetical protein [Planctomicrobium sp.]
KRDSFYSVRRWAPVATVAVAGLLLVVTINATFPKPTESHNPTLYHSRDAGFSVFPGSSARLKPIPPKTHKPDEPSETHESP